MFSIIEAWDDRIVSEGAKVRIFFRLLLWNDELQRREWHYFGTTDSEYLSPLDPASKTGTLFLHEAVLIPRMKSDFNERSLFKLAHSLGLSANHLRITRRPRILRKTQEHYERTSSNERFEEPAVHG